MAFKTIDDERSSEKYKFEKPGQVLEGYYLGATIIDIKGKKVTKHTFKSADATVGTLGSIDLNTKLGKVAPGSMTRVTYKELKKLPGGNTLKVFKVEEDRDNTDGGSSQPSGPTSIKNQKVLS